MSAKQDLELARDVLAWFADERHWCKRTMSVRQPDDPETVAATCMAGAVGHFQNLAQVGDNWFDHPLLHEIRSVITEQYLWMQNYSGHAWSIIATWNDDWRTGIDDIRLVLEKTIARLEESGASSGD